MCFCGPYAFQRGGIPGDLQEGADFSGECRASGLPIPQKMKDVLEQLHDREEGSDGE